MKLYEVLEILIAVLLTIIILFLNETNRTQKNLLCKSDDVRDVRVISAPPVDVNVNLDNVTVTVGDVNATILNVVDVTGTVGLTGPVTIDGTVDVTGTVGLTGPVTIDGPVDVVFPALSQDAFARLRTSHPYTLFDSSFRYGDSSYYWNSSIIPDPITSPGGLSSVAHLPNESSMLLTVGPNVGDKVIRETKHVYIYQPGKSLLVLCTFVMDADVNSNLRQTVGYYGANDGVFFRRESGVNYFGIRTSTSGSPADGTIAQSSWNADKFPLLEVTRTQIVWFDLEWLGVGSVRCGFVVNGKFVLCHTFHHANVDSNDKVYMKTAILPLRYEIERLSSAATTNTFKQICSTIISEGGYTNVSISRTVSTLISQVGPNPSGLIPLVKNKFVPLISIRLKSSPNRLDSVVIPNNIDLYTTDNTNAVIWRLSINRTISTPSWVSVGTNSAVEYDISSSNQLDPNDAGNGFVIREGFNIGGSKGGSISIKQNSNESFGQLGRTIGGVSDILTLSVYATDTNNTAHATFTFQEDTFNG